MRVFSTPPVPIVRGFEFAHDTPGIGSGAVALYTPSVGDILLDLWVEVTETWNGTTPHCDVAQFLGGDVEGWFYRLTGASNIDLTNPDQDFPSGSEGLFSQLITGNQVNGLATLQGIMNAIDMLKANSASSYILEFVANPAAPNQLNNGVRLVPSKFGSVDPIKVCVSQNGKSNGTAAGSTAGSAILYVVTVTPDIKPAPGPA